MAYSLDLRKRVINCVENGGSPSKAAEVFQVGRASIYRCLERVDPIEVKRRNRKLDWKALEQNVQINPETRLIDRAKQFGVRPSAISYALKKMKITRKSGATPRPKGYTFGYRRQTFTPIRVFILEWGQGNAHQDKTTSVSPKKQTRKN